MTPAAKSFSTSITVRLVVCLKIHPAANSIVTLATITWRRPGGLILYCTVLYCTVLYKIRKFADREQTENRQTENSKTEATLIPCGSSGWAGQLVVKKGDFFSCSLSSSFFSFLNVKGNLVWVSLSGLQCLLYNMLRHGNLDTCTQCHPYIIRFTCSYLLWQYIVRKLYEKENYG